MALLGVDEIGKFVSIADEEYRRVVADQVPVAVVSIEFQSKAANVALSVGRTEFPGYGREPRQHVSLGARLQAFCFRVA